MRKLIPIIRQWWYRNQPVPKDEFDISLSLDTEYIMDIMENVSYYERKMNYWKLVRKNYENNLSRRRQIAHESDLKEMDKKSLNNGK
jgi:hypothetical protein